MNGRIETQVVVVHPSRTCADDRTWRPHSHQSHSDAHISAAAAVAAAAAAGDDDDDDDTDDRLTRLSDEIVTS